MTEFQSTFILLLVLISANIAVMYTQYPRLSVAKKREKVLDIAYAFVLDAERTWGVGNEDIKRAQVKARLYVTVYNVPQLRCVVNDKAFVERAISVGEERMKEYIATKGDVFQKFHK